MMLPSESETSLRGAFSLVRTPVREAEHTQDSAAARRPSRKGNVRMQAYCLKCRTKRDMQNPTQVTMKNGKQATKGSCPVCSTAMYRIGKS